MRRQRNFFSGYRELSVIVLLTATALAAGCDGSGDVEAFRDVTASNNALGEELIANGTFANGANNWYLGQWGGSSSGAVTSGRYRITVSTAGTEWWNVQFMQGSLSLVQGKRYELSFDAYKGPVNTGVQKMVVNVGEDGGDYTSYFNDYGPEVTLTTTSIHYSFAFDMTAPSDPAARVEFNCGKNTGTFFIDNVSLKEISADEGHLSVSTQSVDFGNVAVNGSATRTVTLSNGGTLPTQVTAAAFNNPGFSAGISVPFVVPAGGTNSLPISFTPTAAGAVSGTLTIQSDASDNPLLTVNLVGFGFVPGLYITPTSLPFSVSVNESTSANIVLQNTAMSAVTFSVVTDATWLTVSPAFGTIPAGGQATMTAVGNATGLSDGDYTGAVVISHNATNIASPFSVQATLAVADGYQPQSPYLVNPELAIPYVEGIAAFRRKAKDNVNGGFYTFINRQGNPTTENTKSLCAQSRLGYAFTRAFSLTGNETYLDDAHHALKFLYDHGWQNGWLFATDIQGNYISHWGHNDWWSFQQHYALVGIAAMVEVTGGELNWGDGSQTDGYWLDLGLDSNYTRLWDSNPATAGYFDRASTDWSAKWGKGFHATVDAVTTHSLLTALMTGASEHVSKHFELMDEVLDRMVAHMPTSAVGFPEIYNSNWSIDTSQTLSEPGHMYKTAWCLYRSYLMDPTRTEYKAAADAIMWDMWENGGYDRVYGGPYSKINWQTGQTTNTDKNNWMMEQGVTAGLTGYHAAATQADRDMFLETADGSARFFMEHIIDPVYGEAYSDVSRTGASITIADKGGLYNSGYHSIELGYYIYLYGNLFVKKRPVTLYYKFPTTSSSRNIRLTPLAAEDNLLKISAVTLGGATYSNFDGNSRTLTLPAGVGGKFAVTFTMSALCGNGTLDSGEACDDGNTVQGDGCDAACNIEIVCGDGSVGPGEACDDGDTDNNDNCLTTCQPAACGDGFVWFGVESCDDGNSSNLDGCLNNCTAATCGDGYVRAGVEGCDDGNLEPMDGCDELCMLEFSCTDGVQNGDETGIDCGGACPACACEPTVYTTTAMTFSTGGAVSDGYNIWSNGTGTVSHNFDAGATIVTVYARGEIAGGSGPNMVVKVGNTAIGNITLSDTTMQPYSFNYTAPGGIQTITVQFTNDYYQSPADRNLIIGRIEISCNGSSPAVCGDGQVDSQETCDDGNTSNTDACLDTCVAASCGDGYVWNDVEACDDGNSDNSDACLNSCELPSGTGAFVEASGRTVMEAEHYKALVADKTTHDQWSAISVSSASFGSCMQVGPDSTTDYHVGRADVQANAARMDFDVEFQSAGARRFWIRGASTANQGYASNSCHAGIDGAASALNLDFPTNGTYSWVYGAINVASAGVHTVHVFMREDGFIADKIILSADTSYTPTGTGPAESVRR